MKNLNFMIFLVLVAALMVGTTFASSNTTSNTSVSSNTLGVSSALSSNALGVVSPSTANQLNTTVALKTFDKVISPFSVYVDVIVITIFVIILLYGVMIIYSKEFDPDITNERKLRMVVEYAIGSAMVLLLIPYIYAYVHYFPQIVQVTAPKLVTVSSMIPTYVIWFDLFISILISLVGFLLAMREFIKYIKTYQTGGTGNNGVTEAERAQILQRVFAITIFMFLSPFILGILFITITQVFFSASIGMSSSLVGISSTVSGLKFPFYQTNLYTQCSLIPSSYLPCTEYTIASGIYGVGFQSVIFNAVVGVMTSSWGSLPLFMILYDIFVLILMVYSFAKIDWYSLQYLSTLKTGELEARNYNKLKNTYVQYIAFLLSPIIFVIAILVLNAFVSVVLSIVSSSQLSLVPPLVNLAGVPTVENPLLSFAGDIMSFFGILLLAVVLIVALLKILGGILFAVGIFLYFSEDIRNKMFGKNLLILFVILYMLPIIIILIYSAFFGLLPSLISQSLGYGNGTAVATSLGGYYSTVSTTNKTQIEIYGGNTTISLSCVNRSQISGAVKNLSGSPNNRNALGVLLGSCQNFVGYWSNGYDVVALVTIIMLIVLIIGFPAIASALSGVTGLGGGGVSGATSLTAGINGKPLMSKLSTISQNAQKNRENFIKKVKNKANDQHKTLREYAFGSLNNKVSGNLSKAGSAIMRGVSSGENLAYTSTMAPIEGTALGSAINQFRTKTKSLISETSKKTMAEIEGNQGKFISNSAIENYAKKHLKRNGETDKDAVNRFKKLLKENYNAEIDKYGNIKMNKNNFEKLQKDTHYKFKSTKHFYNSAIEEAVNNRDSEIKSTNDNYDPKIEKAKKAGNEKEVKRLMAEKENKISNIKNKHGEKLDEIAKKENFKDYNSYVKLKKMSNDIDAITDSDSYIDSQIKKAKEEEKANMVEKYAKLGIKLSPQELNKKVNESINRDVIIKKAKEDIENKKLSLTKMLKEHGLSVSSITGKSKDLEDILKNDPDDLKSIAYLAFDSMVDSKDTDSAFKIMADAISQKNPDIGYKMKTTFGNFGKEIGIEYLNPMVGAIQNRYKNVKDTIGDLKNYMFVSGIPVYAKYDNQLKEYENKIRDLANSGNSFVDVIKDPNSTHEERIEAQIKIKNIEKELAKIESEKKNLEAKKKSIDHLSAVPKAILKGELIPSFSSYVSALSSDDAKREIGLMEIKKKMLENESRILDKNIGSYKLDLETAKNNLKRSDLTDYQKLQYEKIVNDLKYKISNLNENKGVFKNVIDDVGKMLNENKEIKNIQKVADSIYSNSTIEGQIYNDFSSILKSDSVLSKINTMQNKVKQAKENNEIPEEISGAISSIVKQMDEAISNKRLSGMNLNSMKLTEEQEKKLQSLITPEISDDKGKIDISLKAISYLKDGKLNDAENVISSSFGKDSLIAPLSDSVLSGLSSAIESAKEKMPDSAKISYNKIIENVSNRLKVGDVKTKEDVENIINEAIKNSELKDIPNSEDIRKSIVNNVNFEERYEDNILKVLNGYMQDASNSIEKEMELISKNTNKDFSEAEKSLESLVSKYGVNDYNVIKIGKYLTTNKFKEIMGQTERVNFDYEVMKTRIKEALESHALEYGLAKSDIEKISKFDSEVFSKDADLNKKYLTALKEVIIPEIGKIKENSASKIISKAISNIENDNYEDRQKEIDAIAITSITTDLARSVAKIEGLMTKNKDREVGLRRAKFGGNLASMIELRTPSRHNMEPIDRDRFRDDDGETKLEGLGMRRLNDDSDDRNEPREDIDLHRKDAKSEEDDDSE